MRGLSVSQLIDELAKVSGQGVGFHSTAWASGFIAVEDEAEFGGGIIGSVRPVVNPAMRELVRRGVQSLPGLLEHVSDERTTRLTIEPMGGGMGGVMAGDEYHARYKDKARWPKGVNSRESFEHMRYLGKYTIKVGDLCYVAVGQIVNRNLNAVRYQPTAIFVVNSPIVTPAIAESVRRDWSGLDTERHRESLVADATDVHPAGRSAAALKRLCFYYPSTGEEIAVQLLSRPLYDDEAVANFVNHGLKRETEPDKWHRMIDTFRERNGRVAAEAIAPFLYYSSKETALNQTEHNSILPYLAREVLAEVWPNYSPPTKTLLESSAPYQQECLLRALAPFASDRIDRAAYELFQSAVHMKLNPCVDPSSKDFRTEDGEDYESSAEASAAQGVQAEEYRDGLIMTCADRLLGKGYDAQLRAYFEERIRQVESSPKDSAIRTDLSSLQEYAKRLRD